jgi:hypothetical protein
MAEGAVPVPATPIIPAKLPRSLLRAMEPLTFDGRNVSVPQTMNCGFDSQYPFSVQNCTLEAITGKRYDNPYLHPNAQICFTLHKRIPFSCLVERPLVTDANYFGNDTDCGEPVAVTYTLISVKLTYESVILDSEAQLASINAADKVYLVDVPYIRMSLMTDNNKYDAQTVSLPKNCKLVYITWLMEDQFVVNEGLHKWLSARYIFPPNMTGLHISMPGKENLVFFEGLANLGVKEGVHSEGLKSYHRQLLQWGAYDKEWSSFFPNRKGAGSLGYDSVIVLPLSQYEISEGQQLKITHIFNDQLSKPRWHLNCFCVVQKQLECTSNNVWTWKDL